MCCNRRSFTREILALLPKIETEFSGQIKLLPFDEAAMYSILVEITPSHGFYAHASFIFRVDAASSYPFQGPRLSCLTKTFHPNISGAYVDNICLNLLTNWLPCYGLKDILYALLFLFYEPNFDDPVNHNASRPEEGLSIELSILKSLMGGTVNGVCYASNEAWCRWAEENNVSVSFSSCSLKSSLEKSNEVSVTSPRQQQSALSDYFLQALSGQFSRVAQSTFGERPYQIQNELLIDFAFARHITVKPACTSGSIDGEEVVHSAKRYYYTELGGYSKCTRIAQLTARSAYVTSVEDYRLDWQSKQISVIGFYSLPKESTASVYSEDFFTHEQYLGPEITFSNDYPETPIFLESEYDPRENDNVEEMNVELDAQSVLNYEATDTTASAVPQQHRYSGDTDGMTEPLTNNNVTFPEDIEEVPPEGSPLEVVSHIAERNERLSNSLLTENRQEQQHEQQQTVDDTPERTDWADVFGAALEPEQTSSIGESDRYPPESIDWFFVAQQRTVTKLEPWFWILYRSRWPPYLAPGRITEISRTQRHSQTQRASSTVLRSDLLRVGNRCEGHSLFILVDSLSISPFSPLTNRAVCIKTTTRNAVTWYSLDWFSVWDVFKPTFAGGGGSLTWPSHFRWPTVLFGLCYVHNWVAYLSRMELYGLCLGYSRPWKNAILNYAAASCLTPATLGCGHCGLLDVWPLWLAWRATRLLCHLVTLWSAQAITQKQHQNVARPQLYFPFSDLDEI